MLTNPRLSTAFVLAAALGIGGHAFAEDAAPEAGVITVKVWNLRNDEGQVGC